MVALNKSMTRNRDSDDMKDALQCLSKVRHSKGNSVIKWIDAPKSFRIPDPECPTSAPPGTCEKLEVLCERQSRRESIFHPYDARWDGDTRPLVWYLMKYGEQEKRRLQGGV